MSNSNTNLQTQSSNALHNATNGNLGSKDHPTMFSTVPVTEGSSKTTTERYMENYKNVSQDIRDQLNAEAGRHVSDHSHMDNNISYSTDMLDPNASEIGKPLKILTSTTTKKWQMFVTLVKQSQELKTVSYHKLYDILKQHQNEVNEIKAKDSNRNWVDKQSQLMLLGLRENVSTPVGRVLGFSVITAKEYGQGSVECKQAIGKMILMIDLMIRIWKHIIFTWPAQRLLQSSLDQSFDMMKPNA
ncbi:hypothetical protein Tco_0139736 [Tanacetum coccineum]